MATKIAGRLPLQDMISSVIDDARQKLAASEAGKEGSKPEEKKIKKLLEYEKKEHGGHIPTVKEEEEEEMEEKGEKEDMGEKKASVINFYNYSEVEKLASALEFVSNSIFKVAADSVQMSGEPMIGGTVLPTVKPVMGHQPYKHDASKKHNVPMNPGMASDPSQGSASTQMENNAHKAPGGGGAQKEAAIDLALMRMSGMDKEATPKIDKGLSAAEKFIARQKRIMTSDPLSIKKTLSGEGRLTPEAMKYQTRKNIANMADKNNPGLLGKMKNIVEGKGHPFSLAGETTGVGIYSHPSAQRMRSVARAGDDPELYKKPSGFWALNKKSSSDAAYILNKIAETSQGGMTLDSKSGEGIKPPADAANGNDLRSFLESSEAATRLQKVDAKRIAKRSLADILTEPVQSKSTDSTAHVALSNATKGGVKIAQARALLQKIAEEGCTCSDKGECKYCKMQAAIKAKKEEKAEAAKG